MCTEIYILDSGVRGSHLDFLNKNQKSRVEDGQNFGKNTGPVKLLGLLKYLNPTHLTLLGYYR